jgi:hypothetical protein
MIKNKKINSHSISSKKTPLDPANNDPSLLQPKKSMRERTTNQWIKGNINI